MAFSSASIQKGKKQSLGSYDQEQTRVMGRGQVHWQNQNIDASMPRNHAINIIYNEHAGSVKEAVQSRINEVLENKTIRKDAVTHLPFFATCPNYSQLSEDERLDFARKIYRFLAGKYGAENIVDMRWHFDETTPHIHATIVPITSDGRLSAKEVFKPTKLAMVQWQRDYYEQVAKPLGYDEPAFGRSGEKGYTKETVATREQLRSVESELAEATKQRDAITAQIASESARLESLRQSYRDSDAEKSKLEEDNERLDSKISKLRADNSKLERGTESLKSENQQLRERVRGLEADKSELEAEKGRLERGISKIQSQIKKIGEQVNQLMQQIIDRAEKPQEQSFGQMSLADRGRQAREVADAQASAFERSSSYYEHDR